MSTNSIKCNHSVNTTYNVDKNEMVLFPRLVSRRLSASWYKWNLKIRRIASFVSEKTPWTRLRIDCTSAILVLFRTHLSPATNLRYLCGLVVGFQFCLFHSHFNVFIDKLTARSEYKSSRVANCFYHSFLLLNFLRRQRGKWKVKGVSSKRE